MVEKDAPSDDRLPTSGPLTYFPILLALREPVSRAMATVRACRVVHVGSASFSLCCAAGDASYACHVTAVEDDCVRVCFAEGAPASSSAPPPPRTHAVLTQACSPETLACHVELSETCVTLRTRKLTLKATLVPSLALAWHLPDGTLFAQDRLSRAYAFGTDGGVFHAMRRGLDDSYYGLGDKSGPLNLAGRRLRTHMVDALGRNPESGDPGYKHWPLVLVRTRGAAAFSGVSPVAGGEKEKARYTCFGVYYDTHSAGTFDLGCENSNYYGSFRSFACAGGARELDFYMMLGPELPDCTKRFVRLTGRAQMPPRWALGYGMTAMPLADAVDAQSRISAFVQRAATEGVRASSFHFGSGYTLRDGKRCVFTWNQAKFPDPEALIGELRAAGLHVVANVKPCLLDSHPEFAAVTAAGLCVRAGAADAQPALSLFWDGEGAHIDFGNPGAVAWWRAGVQRALLSKGIETVWNDNNEYELDEQGAMMFSADGNALAPFETERALQPYLMCVASMASTSASAPTRRPFGISRAMSPGCQRLCCTWSGDNESSWASLRWGMRTGLQMALSGMFFTGHDVGGFAGPVPDPELLVRWFQSGLLHPRFVSNSWKACGTVTSPWVHPSVAHLCCAAIQLRLRLMPYLYTLQRCATDGRDEPPLRPVFWNYGADEKAWAESDDLMLGPAMLAAPVVVPGALTREVYLPGGPACWYDFHGWTLGRYPAGQHVTVPAPLHVLPLLCPAGAMVPCADELQSWAGEPHDAPARTLHVFPHPCEGTSHAELFEDDGRSLNGGSVTLSFTLLCSATEVAVSVRVQDVQPGYALPYQVVRLALPKGEERRLVLSGAEGAPRLVRA